MMPSYRENIDRKGIIFANFSSFAHSLGNYCLSFCLKFIFLLACFLPVLYDSFFSSRRYVQSPGHIIWGVYDYHTVPEVARNTSHAFTIEYCTNMTVLWYITGTKRSFVMIWNDSNPDK